MTGFLKGPSSQVRDLVDVEEAFHAVVRLLRTRHDRESGFDASFPTEAEEEPKGPGSIAKQNKPQSSLQDSVCSIECPRLSLRHEGHLKMDESTRVQAEQDTACLLARTIRVAVTGPTEDQPECNAVRIEDLPKVLMSNMYEGFAILVDSRLRVYAKVFLRHLTGLVTKQADALGILQMGQKLETLQDIGGQITALAMQLHFELQDEEDEPEEVSPGVFQQAVELEVTMELYVPSPTGQSRTLPVRHKAQGHLKGMSLHGILLCIDSTYYLLRRVVYSLCCFHGSSLLGTFRDEDNKLQLKLELNTQGLLKSMMDQASLMVAEIVETTNDAFCIAEPKMERGESFFVMPPPMPRKRSAASAGLDILSQAAAINESVIITPDLQARNCDASAVPPLHLEEEDTYDNDENTANVDDLSLDQCASIVDDVFGAMDDALLQGPCLKKPKTI